MSPIYVHGHASASQVPFQKMLTIKANAHAPASNKMILENVRVDAHGHASASKEISLENANHRSIWSCLIFTSNAVS